MENHCKICDQEIEENDNKLNNHAYEMGLCVDCYCDIRFSEGDKNDIR